MWTAGRMRCSRKHCRLEVTYRASAYVLPSRMGKCLKKNSTLLLVCWTMEQYTLATPGCKSPNSSCHNTPKLHAVHNPLHGCINRLQHPLSYPHETKNTWPAAITEHTNDSNNQVQIDIDINAGMHLHHHLLCCSCLMLTLNSSNHPLHAGGSLWLQRRWAIQLECLERAASFLSWWWQVAGCCTRACSACNWR